LSFKPAVGEAGIAFLTTLPPLAALDFPLPLPVVGDGAFFEDLLALALSPVIVSPGWYLFKQLSGQNNH
jgi:ABC-type proline/glycine betaine transport system permease subunit